ncbi:flagellar assembly protein FliW [Acidaminobacter sp. JC074]|uniref:flagellar assembly protein FliW n=1 Tax=Acidaminobacter sp. JC074 TaxID=2530199 RepID=UPI001F0E7B57|nr:flagellar assembly protein FliW [Acidaminobacter sp. JC074]
MKLVTDYRGEVEYTEEDVIEFVDSIYGFDGKTRFLLIGNVEPGLPFHWLQSIEEESLTFVITDPFLFVENYDFELDDFTVEQLEIDTVNDLIVYTTVIIPDEIEDITVNLKSPIVVNANNRKAKQVILKEEFAYKHKIFDKGED